MASLDAATRHDRPSSHRYLEILRPIGLGDELRAALVVGSECWGYLCLHRSDDPLGFSLAEVALLARVGPHIAHGLRQATLLHGEQTPFDTQRPGVLLLADDLSVVATTPDAEHLLSLIDDRSTALPLPVAVYSVAAMLGSIERGAGAGPPSTRVRTAGGHWLDVHASRLQGAANEGRIAVVVETSGPRSTTPLRLAAHGLTARECEVAVLVLRGESTRVISDLRRRDLVGHLLAPPGSPLR